MKIRYNNRMLDFHQKRKLRGVMNSRYIQVILMIIFLVISWSAINRFLIALEMSERREKVENDVAELQIRKAEMEERVQYLSDERGIEAELRRQFDVALEGEQVVVIVDNEANDESTATTSRPTEDPAWYEFWR